MTPPNADQPVARLTDHYAKPGGGSRAVEDLAFVVAIVLIVLRSLSELGHEWLCVLRECRLHTHQFPWGFAVTVGILALPKVVSRATYGRIWEAIGGGLAKLVGRGRPAAPGEKDE